jgi:hypothetical protein
MVKIQIEGGMRAYIAIILNGYKWFELHRYRG